MVIFPFHFFKPELKQFPTPKQRILTKLASLSGITYLENRFPEIPAHTEQELVVSGQDPHRIVWQLAVETAQLPQE